MTEPLAALYAFDGKRVAGLKPLVRADVPDAELLAELPGPHEIAASWVLKARLEAGLLGDAAQKAIFAHLPKLTEPDAILHLLQMVQHAPFASVDDVRPLLAHKRTLVRVWALDALGHLAPDEAAPLIEAALDDPSAAMRARARALATGA
jgi:HEAT repeat protein